ncbi:type IIL restriction-modification enzyme MmeI [Corynebacterium cystitidis]|uniref:type IIL restriction-modification enzyme MmeI n=1 Tax=Corynebacterium cystitidis TaxID=35757 RepID=UPI00211DE0B6|nr:type IIL restriction-modification enzyme MmeI [Corynebacterium cystitidis]
MFPLERGLQHFFFPGLDEGRKGDVENHAQEVLDARAEYEGAILADLYDPDSDWLYPALTEVHPRLEAAYGVDFSDLPDAEREAAIVKHLFELYTEAVEG